MTLLAVRNWTLGILLLAASLAIAALQIAALATMIPGRLALRALDAIDRRLH